MKTAALDSILLQHWSGKSGVQIADANGGGTRGWGGGVVLDMQPSNLLCYGTRACNISQGIRN